MTIHARAFEVSVLVAASALVAALILVEYRSRSPEWKTYQRKGIDLAVQRLETQLAKTKALEKIKAISSELESLRNRDPQVIEIRAFGGKTGPERCMTCHFGIEDLSASHPNAVFGCVSCHGGNGPDLTVKGAHVGLRGGRNPARLDLAPVSCGGRKPAAGACHSDREHPILNRVDTVPRSLMATNAGIISVLRFQWGLEKDSSPKFAIRSVSDGKTRLRAIPEEYSTGGQFNLSESHFRKFCAACHLWSPRHRKTMGRLQGCPACHAPYGKDGKYRGGDPTINREETGHPTTHTITNLIPDERCRACHNRSARVGLNYHGQMESAQYGTPFVRGGLNDRTLSDGRFVLNLVPDIHHEKGMACIDCHTGRDTMGDGKIYGHMKDQIEIRCEDCHGTYAAPPKTMEVKKEDPLVQALIRSSPHVKPPDGSIILQTSKGQPLPHVRKTEKGFVLTGKLDGKEHPVTVITGKKNAHRIRGHERMDCDSCHSAWSPQCFGCHQLLDFGFKGKDHISGKKTPGRWAEARGHLRFARNIYGINSRGKVGILVPGCQVWNTVIDSQGKVIAPYDSKIMKLKNGNNSIAMGPTHPHTTRTEVPRCVDCHLDPKALGLGEGRLARANASLKLENVPANTVWPSPTERRNHSVHRRTGTSQLGRTTSAWRWNAAQARPDNRRPGVKPASLGNFKLEPIYDSKASGLKISFPIDAMVDTNGKVLQGASHKPARPFNGQEIKRILSIAPCLPCHDRYDDPVWEKPPPYVLQPACRQALK